jgi:formate dehydrogenase (coenzyme F420) beta subunit
VKELRDKVREAFKQERIDVLLGWRADPATGAVKPHVFQRGDDLEQLVFDDRCVHNLVTFLPEVAGHSKKTGVVLKGCDGRAFVTLLAEKRLKRDGLRVITVACDGVKIDGRTAAKCADCVTNVSPVADVVIGEKRAMKPAEYKQLEYIEKMKPEERWQFFAQQFERCARCYSCRQVCPMCYCETCIAEQVGPAWIDASTKLSANTMWQLSRAYHLAGRCADCGECERACPERLPLRMLNAAMQKAVAELFEVVPGNDPDVQPPLSVLAQGDPDSLLEGKR